MRYDLCPSTKCYIFSVAIGDILYKKNCHVLNNGFKMETLRHLNDRSLYASQISQYTFLPYIHMSQKGNDRPGIITDYAYLQAIK